MVNRTALREKIREAVFSVLPISLIIITLCFTIAPVSTDVMLSFLVGAVMLMLGMGLFTLGAEMSMTQIGNAIGARMTRSRKLGIVLLLSFILGVAVTVAEPDLQVLATTAPHIDTLVLVASVAIGVGIFLMVSMLRILFSIKLKWLLIGLYAIVFLLAAFTDADFLGIAFDSGGVTTGPMTVPFIMAIGVGVACIRSDKNAEADSFGLVALCSIGPILAVMALGFLYNDDGSATAATAVSYYENTVAIGGGYVQAIPQYLREIAVSLAPMVVFFLLFQVFSLKLRKIPFLRIIVGLIYTYVGLVLFLVGVNVGFSSLGTVLGGVLATGWARYLLIPIAMLMGWYIISAEPAVHVLNKQVAEISAGAVSAKAMGLSLSVAIAIANGLAMVRVLTGISILWFLVPGYAIALALSFFVPQLFTAIAFDSGGVASGPMTAAFMLPFAIGASQAVGGNPLSDAFGLVALVAMMPLITVQIMGVISVVKARGKAPATAPVFADSDVIELWEAM